MLSRPLRRSSSGRARRNYGVEREAQVLQGGPRHAAASEPCVQLERADLGERAAVKRATVRPPDRCRPAPRARFRPPRARSPRRASRVPSSRGQSSHPRAESARHPDGAVGLIDEHERLRLRDREGVAIVKAAHGSLRAMRIQRNASAPSRRKMSMRARFESTMTRSSVLPEQVDQGARLERVALRVVEPSQRQQVRQRHLHSDAQAVRVGGAAPGLDDLARLLERESDLIRPQRPDPRRADLDVDGQPAVGQRFARHECTGLADGLERARRPRHVRSRSTPLRPMPSPATPIVAPVRSAVRRSVSMSARRDASLSGALAVCRLEVDRDECMPSSARRSGSATCGNSARACRRVRRASANEPSSFSRSARVHRARSASGAAASRASRLAIAQACS